MAKSSSVESGTLFGVPSLDIEAIVVSQRKNLEALTQANELAINGAQAIVRRQFEIGRQIADEFSTVFGDLVQPNGSLEERLAKQAEFSTQAIEKSLSNAREIGELVSNAGKEALSVISKRMLEGFDEMRAYTGIA